MAPGLTLLGLTTLVPLVFLVGTSLFHYDLSAPDATRFVGIDNFVALAQDTRFWNSLQLSAIYTVSTVILQIVLGLALAMLVIRIQRGRGLVRIAAILPLLLAPVVVGLVWRSLILTPDFGILDIATSMLGFGSHHVLGSGTSALVAVIIMHTWQWTPFAFLVFLASLATIPDDILEAARIDRAGAWQRFWHIILPLLRPIIVVVAIVRLVISLTAFDAIFAATGGGPGTATEILNLYIYRTAFNELSLGYGATLAVVLLALILTIAVFFFRLRRQR